jgi:electron transport complex protein RnfB
MDPRMTETIYRRLARHLDTLPGGFPSTTTGVEMRILRRLFTPEEAALAVHLTLIPEPARIIAHRAGLGGTEADALLEQMAGKGLVFRVRTPHQALYQAIQYVVGIWEFQINNLDADLIRDMNEYLPTLFRAEEWRRAPQLRTVPVAQSIPIDRPILPYEDAVHILRSHRRIVVAPCICRREARMMGHACDRPEETCLVLGATTEYYLRNGLGRSITVEEGLKILAAAERTGLVLQPGGSQKPNNICCCCGCCCQVLKGLKRHPRPASLVSSPFVVSLEVEECLGCGDCVDRCQMQALSLEDGHVVHTLDRCIGCGLCVTACPAECLHLVRKPERAQPEVPRDAVRAGFRLARARGKVVPLLLQIARAELDRRLVRD